MSKIPPPLFSREGEPSVIKRLKRMSGFYLFQKYFSRNALPYWMILVVDSVIILFSSMFAAYLLVDNSFLIANFFKFCVLALASLPFLWVFMKVFHTYSGILRFSSFNDLFRVVMACLCGSVLFWCVCYVLKEYDVWEDMLSLKLTACSVALSSLFMCLFRMAVAMMYDFIKEKSNAQNILIYGVKQGGIALATSVRNEHPAQYIVKGFITPDKDLKNLYLLGSKIYYADENIKDVIEKYHISSIFVSPLFVNEFRNNDVLVKTIIDAGVRIMMKPEAEAWDGKSSLSHRQLHEVDIEDLLPREKIEVDMEAIGAMLRGKRILITGAAGSIGSEMARQVATFAPAELVLVDQAETPMHDVRLYMMRNYPEMVAPTIVGSICNQTQMEEIFRKHRPEYVFHAAAYKHVPMMEDNPAMAVQNNIYGTRVIADLAVKYGTKKFVMISTDKAVNPTNVMGCSKRICEIYCQALNKAIADGSYKGNVAQPTTNNPQPTTQFITTRFGNVLGSNGSVIPIFKEQIKKGGPVTVTHPDIIRFFMLIPEACQLVLEAGTMGHGGEIFVFDMGKPVRIADLAQRMIDLSHAKDVKIQFTGLRDGEKLYEEVLSEAESNRPTPHPKIMVARVREYPYDLALQNEKELYDLSFTYDDMAIVKKMKEIVPEYKSRHSKYETLD